VARVSAAKVQETKTNLLEAARQVLVERGYEGLTTRAVAGVAGAPMSQIQYHFGSKEGLITALFVTMDGELRQRQEAMFSDSNLTLSQQWDQACDYLEQDLASGYVRVLHELMAASLANAKIRAIVRDGMMAWFQVLRDVAEKFERTYPLQSPFEAYDLSALVGAAFVGAEAYLLLGMEEAGVPVRRALRRVGDMIRSAELQSSRRES